MNPNERKPEAFFTPRAPVRPDMFARREEGQLQQRLSDALRETGSQIMLYGDTGVGKTSLLLHVANEMGLGVARIECLTGKTFQDLIRDSFTALAEVQELRMEQTTSHSGTAEIEAGGGIGWLASLRGRLRAEAGGSERHEFVVLEQPMIDALLESMQVAGKAVLFFDNFENVREATVQQQVAEFISVMSDRAQETSNIKLVIAGIAETAGDLLTLSGGASRRTVDFEVTRMPDSELLEILERGAGFLGLSVDEAVVPRWLDLCDGFPYVMHLLALHASREAIRSGTNKISRAEFDQALRMSLGEFREEFGRSYERAAETRGEVQARRRILSCLAWHTDRDFLARTIETTYRERYAIPTDQNLAYLNVALGELITPERGEPLRRRGPRGQYRYGFRNPLMRPYIRMREEQQQLGLR